jgi:hypothetical protein
VFYKYGKLRITEEDVELTPTPTLTEDLYLEVDDVNPNQVIYDLENNTVIVPTEEEEMVTNVELQQPSTVEKRVISRNVNNTQRRNFR